MKILVVSQYFWPENFRINDLCAELVRRGHEVTILTGKPNYPEGVVNPAYRKRPQDFNEYNGCSVVRVPIFTRGRGSSIKLILNYASFALSASVYGLFKLRKQNFDVIFVFEPSPITVGIPAILLKKFKKAPIAFWVLDLWPETLEAIGVVKSERLLKLIGKLVSFIYKRCDLILGQSKAFLPAINRYSDEPVNVRYFPSWSEDLFSNSNKFNHIDEINQFKSTFKILFAGNVGEAQDFISILKTMEIIKLNKVNAKLFVVGDGRMFDWVQEQIKTRELEDYICLLGRYPLEKMPDFYFTSDALLVTLKNSPVFSMTIPGKVQSYMAAGKPILTMLSGEGSRVVKEAGCGYVANSGDYKMLAANIMKMVCVSEEELIDFGRKSLAYSQKEFNRNSLITQLELWFDELNSRG